jgi:NAD(P)-dependent dehydrogenase (short-subunit alcohol dehydrogenase family)
MSPAVPGGRFADQTALVTGGSRGIGVAIARRLASEGARVLATSRLGDAGAEMIAPGVQFVRADVCDERAVAAAVKTAGDGRSLDICVANAGVLLVEDFLHADTSGWDRLVRTNLLGVMLSFRVAAEQMAAAGRGGKLVAVASTSGLRGEARTAAYSASKAGVIALVESLASELGPRGITVNAVAPGEVDTQMHAKAIDEVAVARRRSVEAVREDLVGEIPLGRLGSAEDVAAAVAFLASRDADYITGTALRIDGGSSLT